MRHWEGSGRSARARRILPCVADRLSGIIPHRKSNFTEIIGWLPLAHVTHFLIVRRTTKGLRKQLLSPPIGICLVTGIQVVNFPLVCWASLGLHRIRSGDRQTLVYPGLGMTKRLKRQRCFSGWLRIRYQQLWLPCSLLPLSS